jgi:hypothetical protein
MCGICGQFNFQHREPVEREPIVRMARSIAHRGPDDEGFFISGPVGLGFRRLSIIDLVGGPPPTVYPMPTEKGGPFPAGSEPASPLADLFGRLKPDGSFCSRQLRFGWDNTQLTLGRTRSYHGSLIRLYCWKRGDSRCVWLS